VLRACGHGRLGSPTGGTGRDRGSGTGARAFGAGFSLTFSAAVPWLDEAFGEVERGLGYGVLNLLYATGYTIGPLIGGALLEVASATAAYVVTAVALAGCALVVLRRVRAPTAGPA
jgi:MFS family permease